VIGVCEECGQEIEGVDVDVVGYWFQIHNRLDHPKLSQVSLLIEDPDA